MLWAFLVAQLVKNPPTMHEPWVQSLGWEDPLEKRKAFLKEDKDRDPSSSYSAIRIIVTFR